MTEVFTPESGRRVARVVECTAMEQSPSTLAPEQVDVPPASKCPIDHVALAASCPMGHTATDRPVPHRSRADLVMRKVLRIRERPEGMTTGAAYSAFQKSMLISATRCTLTYVIFPFVLPVVGIARGVGPMLGITIGVVAMVCDVFSIRRFFAVDHKWRWHFTAVATSVIGLLTILLVQDIAHLLS